MSVAEHLVIDLDYPEERAAVSHDVGTIAPEAGGFRYRCAGCPATDWAATVVDIERLWSQHEVEERAGVGRLFG